MVIWKRATEAELVATRAMNCWNYARKVSVLDLAFDRIFAIGSGTPLEDFEIINVCSCEKSMISSIVRH